MVLTSNHNLFDLNDSIIVVKIVNSFDLSLFIMRFYLAKMTIERSNKKVLQKVGWRHLQELDRIRETLLVYENILSTLLCIFEYICLCTESMNTLTKSNFLRLYRTANRTKVTCKHAINTTKKIRHWYHSKFYLVSFH